MTHETIITAACIIAAASILTLTFYIASLRNRADRAEAVTRYEQRRNINSREHASSAKAAPLIDRLRDLQDRINNTSTDRLRNYRFNYAKLTSALVSFVVQAELNRRDAVSAEAALARVEAEIAKTVVSK